MMQGDGKVGHSRSTMPYGRTSAFVAIALAATAILLSQETQRRWLAGDSHIHSYWSPGYDRTKSPPEPVRGGDALYSTPQNARKAREFGLTWMVTTDHGGANHSKLNLTQAYEELKQSRQMVPDVFQFYGMELNMPAMDHHTLIIPRTDDEWKTLFNIESQFDSNETWPRDPSRNSEAAGFRALTFMNGLRDRPLMFANHPSRSAQEVGRYGLDEPREFRNNNDLAPHIYRGMEGAPGHQAGGLAADGSPKRDAEGRPTGNRGSYGNANARTFGGFDQMTAIVGGLWDALLGEERRFWIVATSDSHANFADDTRAGSDFWPGQFHKTYVWARRTAEDILEGLRAGRMFVVAGDLISELGVQVTSGRAAAGIGDTLRVAEGDAVRVTVTFRDPHTRNARGEQVSVKRVDLIVGQFTGAAANRNADRNETAKVVARFTSEAWSSEGDVHTITTTVPTPEGGGFIRVRGTSTTDLEPPMDQPGEDPWTDLWFYSNPVFVEIGIDGQP
jgi:hypothetical protein